MAKILVVVALIFGCAVALADEVSIPNFLVGSWTQQARFNEVDKVTIGKDLSIRYDMSRQVGTQGSGIPYPTDCRYREIGKIVSVERPASDEINYFRSSGKEDPTYSVTYNVSKVELLPSPNNSANCAKYVKEKNAAAASVKSPLQFTWDISDLSDSIILDPWYDTVFTKK